MVGILPLVHSVAVPYSRIRPQLASASSSETRNRNNEERSTSAPPRSDLVRTDARLLRIRNCHRRSGSSCSEGNDIEFSSSSRKEGSNYFQSKGLCQK